MSDVHQQEPHSQGLASRLNWLRAGVLGANDGIVSTAGLVVGVAGATSARSTILVAGLAGLVAGALSMAGGEYVSVSSQRDTERAALRQEEWELAKLPDHELEELAAIYVDKGLTPELARDVARQLTEHDALAAHAEAELGIDPDELTNPLHAAWSSMPSLHGRRPAAAAGDPAAAGLAAAARDGAGRDRRAGPDRRGQLPARRRARPAARSSATWAWAWSRWRSRSLVGSLFGA